MRGTFCEQKVPLKLPSKKLEKHLENSNYNINCEQSVATSVNNIDVARRLFTYIISSFSKSFLKRGCG